MNVGTEHATWSIAAFILICCGAILYFIFQARAGRKLFLRRIPGLTAVDDAVGRATEMGRPVVFSIGLGGLDMVTFVAMAVLQYVAEATAKFRAKIVVPVADATAFPVTREVCRNAYHMQGHDEELGWDDVRYLAGGQFAWAMAVAGLMTRESAAATFYFGSYGAESLMLAETGQAVGAVQVAGTPSQHQIPFFIVSCDYTIFGEEFYAASAYLSRNPIMIGSLRGQDVGKVVIFGLVVLGALTATVAAMLAVPGNWLVEVLTK